MPGGGELDNLSWPWGGDLDTGKSGLSNSPSLIRPSPLWGLTLTGAQGFLMLHKTDKIWLDTKNNLLKQMLKRDSMVNTGLKCIIIVVKVGNFC